MPCRHSRRVSGREWSRPRRAWAPVRGEVWTPLPPLRHYAESRGRGRRVRLRVCARPGPARRRDAVGQTGAAAMWRWRRAVVEGPGAGRRLPRMSGSRPDSLAGTFACVCACGYAPRINSPGGPRSSPSVWRERQQHPLQIQCRTALSRAHRRCGQYLFRDSLEFQQRNQAQCAQDAGQETRWQQREHLAAGNGNGHARCTTAQFNSQSCRVSSLVRLLNRQCCPHSTTRNAP